MTDPALRELVRYQLARVGGRVTVDCQAQLGQRLQIDSRHSNRSVSRAMGSLVHAREVIRSRRPPQHMYDDDRPITFILRL